MYVGHYVSPARWLALQEMGWALQTRAQMLAQEGERQAPPRAQAQPMAREAGWTGHQTIAREGEGRGHSRAQPQMEGTLDTAEAM